MQLINTTGSTLQSHMLTLHARQLCDVLAVLHNVLDINCLTAKMPAACKVARRCTKGGCAACAHLKS